LLKQIIKHKKFQTSNSNYLKTSKYQIKNQLAKKRQIISLSIIILWERLVTSKISATSNKFYLSLSISYIFVAPSL
jgi:hypothetical protein